MKNVSTKIGYMVIGSLLTLIGYHFENKETIMKKLFQYITTFTFTLFVIITVATAQTPQDVETTVLDSTVILTMDTGSQGSGFFIAPDLIVTSYSLIKGTSSGAVSHEKNYPIIGIAAANEYDDLVILKVSGAQGRPFLIGDSDLVKEGDTVSIVRPLEPSLISSIVTETTISEIRNSLFTYEFLIDTPDSLARGGEPVLNDKGKVIGVFQRTDPDKDNLNQNFYAIVASENLNSLIIEATGDSQKFPRPLSADGVSGTHLTWGPDYYEFTLWNHRNETLYDPQCVVIFRDEKGEVICADPVEWGGMMFAGSGARVSRNFFSNPKPGHFKGYFYDPASKPDSPGDYFTVSLVGPRVKQIMHSYEIRIIDLTIDTRFPSQKESLKGFTGDGLTWFELSKYSQVDGIEQFQFPRGANKKDEDSPKEVGFSYSVQNNLSTDFTNVRLTLVFYDKEGIPIDQWEINNAVDILAKQTVKVKGHVSRSTKQLAKSVEPRIVPFPFKPIIHKKPKILSSTSRRTDPPATTHDKDLLPRLMGILEDLSLDSRKLKFIEDNPHLLPDSLSLGELNSILNLFTLDSDKLKVTKIFVSRLQHNYSDREFERFKDHYTLDSDKLEAIHLILEDSN